MISFILFLVLAWSFYIGYSRGLILQVYYLFAAILSCMIASGFYKQLANLFYLWVPFANATQGSSTYYFDSHYLFRLDRVFYAGLAFLLIYVAVYVGLRFIGIFMHVFQFATPDTGLLNSVSGGISVLVTAFGLQLLVTLLATIPVASIQEKLHGSGLANFLIQYTPLTSSFLKQLWVTNILG